MNTDILFADNLDDMFPGVLTGIVHMRFVVRVKLHS